MAGTRMHMYARKKRVRKTSGSGSSGTLYLMKNTLRLLTLFSLGTASAFAAIIVQPVSVSILGASVTGDGDGAAANSFIDGNGLANSSAYVTGSAVPLVWDTHAFANATENGNYRTGNFPPGGTDFTFTFALGGSYDLTGMHVWGYNADADNGYSSPGLALNKMRVEVSTNGGADWTLAADLTGGNDFPQPTLAVPTAGETLSFAATALGVNAVRFTHMDSIWSPGGGDFYNYRKGIAEVRFIADTSTTYEAWRTLNFNATQQADDALTGPAASFANDGTPNLLKYALGLAPTARLNPAVDTPTTIATDRLQLRFTRDPAKTDLIYEVQASTDLVNWTALARSTAGEATANLAAFELQEATQDALVSVTVTDTTQLSTAATRRFLRLKVTK